MSSIGTFCAMLSTRERIIRGAAFTDSLALSHLTAGGLVVPAGHVATMACMECDEMHVSEIECVGGELGWYCVDAGFVHTSPHDVAAFEVRGDALAARLHGALAARGRVYPWPKEAPLLWHMGEFAFTDLAIDACLVPNVGDPDVFNELGRFLSTPRGHPQGTAILTNDNRDLSAIMLPDGIRIVHLVDVVKLADDGHVQIELEALARFTLPARFLHPRRPGRPRSKRELAIDALKELDRLGRLVGVSDRELQRRTLEFLQACYGQTTNLGRSTFLEALQEYRRTARSS